MEFLPIYYQYGDYAPSGSLTSYTKVGDIVKLPGFDGNLETFQVASIEVRNGKVIVNLTDL